MCYASNGYIPSSFFAARRRTAMCFIAQWMDKESLVACGTLSHWCFFSTWCSYVTKGSACIHLKQKCETNKQNEKLWREGDDSGGREKREKPEGWNLLSLIHGAGRKLPARARWIRFPFSLCWHHSYFGVTMGRTSMYLGNITVDQWALAGTAILCKRASVILTLYSLKEVKGAKIKYTGMSGQSLSWEGVPHSSQESGSYRFCLSL